MKPFVSGSYMRQRFYVATAVLVATLAVTAALGVYQLRKSHSHARYVAVFYNMAQYADLVGSQGYRVVYDPDADERREARDILAIALDRLARLYTNITGEDPAISALIPTLEAGSGDLGHETAALRDETGEGADYLTGLSREINDEYLATPLPKLRESDQMSNLLTNLWHGPDHSRGPDQAGGDDALEHKIAELISLSAKLLDYQNMPRAELEKIGRQIETLSVLEVNPKLNSIVNQLQQEHMVIMAGLTVLGGVSLLLILSAVIGNLFGIFRPMEKVVLAAHAILETANADLEKKVAERTAELEVAFAGAHVANRAKAEFLRNISHELRTPLNGILGMTELLRASEHAKYDLQYIDIILDSGKGLLQIVNDILNFSRIEDGKAVLNNQTFDLWKICGAVTRRLSAVAVQKHIYLSFAWDSTLPAVYIGDGERIRQIVTNLVGNALKFTAKGCVTLKVSGAPGTGDQMDLVIKVIDTGIGIPADKYESIFGMFEQADNSTTRNFGGTGLGLAIAGRLVAAMNGTISVSSQVGEGSTFTVCLSLPVEDARRAAA